MASFDEVLRQFTKEAEAGHGCTIAHMLGDVSQADMIAAFNAMTKQNETNRGAGQEAMLGWGAGFVDKTNAPSGDLSTDLSALTTSSSSPIKVTLDKVDDKGDLKKVVLDMAKGTVKNETMLTATFVDGKMVTESCRQSDASSKK